ncbi:ATP-binding protein involved in chromosome partitioning [Halobiforma haloterrestris]|uniref:ATP-binding protein involved in chromosome partitioning n=1 Tax=Natronobacterium haloterrestre TaxID=148448 RepID=A0A1I1IGK8_NATHA|nr:iron-sulfur cluster assembly protein [Halobiforma haloterrestris]SFC34812.1 ATP-binding protein involved in chromosome partitioning [Halobiforma haloterrestris]
MTRPPADPRTREQLRERLRAVEDPILDDDIVSLGLVTDLTVEGDDALVSLAFNAPLSPAEWEMCDEIRALCRGMGLTPRLYADTDRSDALPGVRNAVAVGTTVPGAAPGPAVGTLTMELERLGASVGVFDLRPEPTVESWLDGVEPPDVSDDPFVPPEARGVPVVRLGSLVPDPGAVPATDAVLEFLVPHVLERAEWGPIDYLLVVLPSSIDALPEVAVNETPIEGTIAVGPVDEGLGPVRTAARELDSATPVIGTIGTADDGGPPRALEERRQVGAGPTPAYGPDCGRDRDRFHTIADVEEDLGCPYLGTLTPGAAPEDDGDREGSTSDDRLPPSAERPLADESENRSARAVATAVADLVGRINRRHAASRQTA